MASSQNNFSSQVIICTMAALLLLATVAIAASLEDRPSVHGHQHESTRSKRAWPVPSGHRGRQHPAVLQPIHRDNRPLKPIPVYLPMPRPVPRPVPSAPCVCDETRMSQIEEQIANLMTKMEEQTTQTTENKENIDSLMVSNSQLQSQISEVVSENQALKREARALESRSSSLTRDNERLRAENEQLMADQLLAAVDQRENTGERDDADTVTARQSSLRELNDVMGNREAEMMEMGFPEPEGPASMRPEGRSREVASDPAVFGSGSDTENLAASMLALNQENENLARKMEQLEGKINQQQRNPMLGGMAGPQFRQAPQESDDVTEKIARLERLVLLALQSPPAEDALFMSGPAGSGSIARPHARVGSKRFMPPPSRGSTGGLSVVNTMSDEDLDEMANVVESVRNKSPRKCAFSVASTGVTLGVNENARVIEFDHEFVNKGNDFQMRQNRFFCEHPGFYFITFTLRSYDGKYLGVALMKNEDIQTAVYTDASNRNVMQTQSILLHMDTDDQLWLRNAPSDKFAVHSGIHRYVTFSGFLVYRGS